MKTLTERISDACATHDIRSVLGLAERKSLIVCPLPQHVHHRNTPSFSIFYEGGKQWWRCHGSCDTEGDVIDLVGFLRVPNYDKRDPDKIREALKLIDERFEVSIPEPEERKVLTGREYLDFLPFGPEVETYAAKRGLTKETLLKFRIGQNGKFMTIPLFEEGILKGIKMRKIVPCDPDKRFFQLGGSRLGLFNYDNVELRTGVVFVVKGEIPAMLMDQLGFLACAPTAGEGSYKGQVFRWNTALALAAKVVVGDNDAPGKVLGKKRSMLFGGLLKFPPPAHKDLDEWILGDRERALQIIRQWQEEAERNW